MSALKVKNEEESDTNGSYGGIKYNQSIITYATCFVICLGIHRLSEKWRRNQCYIGLVHALILCFSANRTVILCISFSKEEELMRISLANVGKLYVFSMVAMYLNSLYRLYKSGFDRKKIIILLVIGLCVFISVISITMPELF